MKTLASIAEKGPTHRVKGRKFAINAPLDTLRMGQKDLKNAFYVHVAFSLQSVHQPVSLVLRVVSPPIHQAIVFRVHQELTML